MLVRRAAVSGPNEVTAARVLVAGDVFPNLPDGALAFRPLRDITGEEAVIVVGNCEGVYSDDPSPAPSHKSFMVAPRQRGSMLGDVPFHVMSLANNHTMDGGYGGLTDTVDLLASQGIATVGAGATLADAARPLVVERGGQRIAFVAVCSVFPVGYEARQERPGIAPLRVRTLYADPDRNFWEPGIAPVIVTLPFPEDLQRFRQSIAAARAAADSVVVLCHWGYSRGTERLLDYELDLARDAVTHGADVVVCAHHHSLRGVEIHRRKPIFYGMGTLVHHLHGSGATSPGRAVAGSATGTRSSRVFDPEYPYFPFETEARMTGFAFVELDRGDVEAVGIVPAMIRPDGSTHPLAVGSGELETYVDHLRNISTSAGFDTSFRPTERAGWALVEIVMPSDAQAEAASGAVVTRIDGARNRYEEARP
jgi:poly-gamma-glutamate capsule biosynthesis protein CapA/YwtB (metallophosphatase superfamily)